MILAAKERLTGKDRYHQHGLVNCHRGELDIKVGIENIARMLRFADTLLSALTNRGHSVRVSSLDTDAVVRGQEMKIVFRERLKKHIVKGTHYVMTRRTTGISL